VRVLPALVLFVALAIPAQAAELKVLSGNGARSAVAELCAAFERLTGHTVTIDFAVNPQVQQRIESGEPFDLAILNPPVLDALIAQGRIVAATRSVIGRAGIGVAARAGAPAPDISTVAAFTNTLLNAESVAYPGEGASGRYFVTVVDRLGIAPQMTSKMRPMPAEYNVEVVGKGEVELVVVVASRIAGVPGVQLVGLIPQELQTWIGFTGGMSAAAREPEAARALLRFLTSPAAVPALEKAGIQPFMEAQEGAPQGAAPDSIFINGKIVTVDERFTVAEAVAVRGERIVAVGSSQDIVRLAGPSTRRIDLRGRTVLPGLIDNHMHLLRYGTTWKYEVRWDGVETRREALALLRARAQTLMPGEWIYTLGGWALEQFADDPKPFTRQELDAVAPANPVFLQASYFEAFLNSRAIRQLGAQSITGHVDEVSFRSLVDKLPIATGPALETSTRGMIRALNQSGLTAAGSAGCEPELLGQYRRWADRGQLNVRVFCITTPAAGANAGQFLSRIAGMKVFQGDAWVDQVAFGENFGALSDPMFRRRPPATAEDLATWRRIVTEVAKAGLPLHVHANFTETIDAFLDEIEAVNREYPIRNLRWVLAHFNQPNAGQLERMKRLGMYAAVHPWAVINGGINVRQFGEAAYAMAPLATIQQSGITWGLGSDGSRANQILPFETLSWAVTGKMVGGRTVLRQPVGREDALIAHTRKNAYFVFREDDLGSIEAGKMADLIAIDRDYLTVPADQIKDIRVLMTVVGGRIVYDAERE